MYLLYAMDFIPFLQEMLGITEDFGIVNIEKIETSEKIIRIYLNYLPKQCLIEGRFLNIYDLAPEREWQHLSWFDYKCYLICRLPRYTEVDNIIKTFEPTFAPKGRSYTHLFNKESIRLLSTIKVQSQVATIMKTTPYIIRRIMEDAVEKALDKRGFITEFKNISIDEKSYAKGHEYATILMDSDKEYIIDMHEGRKEKSLKALFYNVSGEEKQLQLKVVNIDMWQPYINVIKELAPQATIVHDKFHVVQKLTEAIDKTRKKEISDCTLLKKQKYNVMKNNESRREGQKKIFEQLELANSKTAKAWHVRENFKSLWSYINVFDAKPILETWINNSREKCLYFVNNAIKTIENHMDGVCNAIVTKTTSALHENNNGKLQAIIAKARGFINFDRFRINALFYFGNLNFSH
jgi:transposase